MNRNEKLKSPPRGQTRRNFEKKRVVRVSGGRTAYVIVS